MDLSAAARAPASAVSKADIIGWRDVGTLWGLFCERVRRTPYAIAYREYDRSAGKWCEYSWRAIASRVDLFRCALANDGLMPGDRVAVLLPNGIDWVSFDLAAHGLGLVVVGLYLHDTAASNAAILGHSGARLLLLDTEGRWRSLAPFGTEFPLLQHVWIRDAGHDSLSQSFGPVPRRLANLLAEGSSPPPPHPAEAGDIATLIYTSGTTGPRKSVMLSHFALMWNASAPFEVIPPCQNDVFLSILPLAHAFARADDYYLPMIAGCTVAYARSPNELRQDLITIRPTIIFGVPVLFERMAAAIRKRAGGNFVNRSLLRFVAFLGWRLFQLSQHHGEIGRTGRALFALFK